MQICLLLDQRERFGNHVRSVTGGHHVSDKHGEAVRQLQTMPAATAEASEPCVTRSASRAFMAALAPVLVAAHGHDVQNWRLNS